MVLFTSSFHKSFGWVLVATRSATTNKHSSQAKAVTRQIAFSIGAAEWNGAGSQDYLQYSQGGFLPLSRVTGSLAVWSRGHMYSVWKVTGCAPIEQLQLHHENT